MSGGVKFSNFVNGGLPVAGDRVVGLRTINGTVQNTIFNFNSSGFAIDINQVAHGFVVGNIIRLNGAVYILAQADNATDANVIGIVSAVEDADNFQIQLGGYITGLAGLVAGSTYFLDPAVAGAMTTVEPVALGQIRKPVFIAASATAGFWFNYNGQQL